ncbi:hypothetical protein HII31_12337 [Pseudocercospora fuligena]|uniref:Uncharacterized protein n=1 Tax=Pseudocercospora fuligena TaxID=685502 RepID=A0A8H6R9E9_9PEZI|nr:hypothetical protein HII31_12337 [Pseudocercospora fuligena]
MLLNQRGHKATHTVAVVLLLLTLVVLLVKEKLNDALPWPLEVARQRRTNGNSYSFSFERSDGSNALVKRGKSYDIDKLEGSTLNCLMAGSQEDLPDEYKTQWESYGDIERYGWVMEISAVAAITPSVQSAMDGLKLPPVQDQSWRMVESRHGKASTDSANPGKTYPATGAIYRNVFSCELGVLIAVNNEGPQHVKNAPPRESLVPLRQWSDIMGLQWQKLCGNKPLRYVIRNSVRNPDTLRDLRQIYGVSTFEGLPVADSPLGEYPGKTLTGDSEEGEAIIGSPNGRGVAFLLYQHKKTFGDTTHIKSMKVWNADQDIPGLKKTSGRANILFELEVDGAAMMKRDPNPLADRVAGEYSSDLRDDATHVLKRKQHHRRSVEIRAKRAPGRPDYYDKDMARGCELNALMRSSAEDPRYAATGAVYHEITDAGWQMVDSESINRNHRYSQDVMAKLKIPPTTDPSWTYIYWKYERLSKDHINPKSGKGYRTGGYYSNAYNCDAGIMLAISNNSPRNAQENPALTASDLPVVEKWSDINALTWKEVCGPNKALHYILRLHVNNDESRNVLRINVGLEPPANKDLGNYPGSSFTPDSSEGLALLGSPNGRGGAFLVSQHKALFGATRQVTKISAWGNTQDPDMLFEFGTTEGDIPSAKVDPSAPYNYPEQQAAIPCFVLPCDDSHKRRMALVGKAKL